MREPPAAPTPTDCPTCGGALESHPSSIPRLFWCDACEKEYWEEGTEDRTWFSCGVDGVIRRA